VVEQCEDKNLPGGPGAGHCAHHFSGCLLLERQLLQVTGRLLGIAVWQNSEGQLLKSAGRVEVMAVQSSPSKSFEVRSTEVEGTRIYRFVWYMFLGFEGGDG